MYWDWYRMQKKHSFIKSWNNWKNIDFGNDSTTSLIVDPYHKNLEQEVLGTSLMTMRQWRYIQNRASRLLDSSKCRMMKCLVQQMNQMQYDIPLQSVVTAKHVQALLLYTTSSTYCTALSETFRSSHFDESLDEMNLRNSRFYWTSRYLRELVFCFGHMAQNEGTLLLKKYD